MRVWALPESHSVSCSARPAPVAGHRTLQQGRGQLDPCGATDAKPKETNALSHSTARAAQLALRIATGGRKDDQVARAGSGLGPGPRLHGPEVARQRAYGCSMRILSFSPEVLFAIPRAPRRASGRFEAVPALDDERPLEFRDSFDNDEGFASSGLSWLTWMGKSEVESTGRGPGPSRGEVSFPHVARVVVFEQQIHRLARHAIDGTGAHRRTAEGRRRRAADVLAARRGGRSIETTLRQHEVLSEFPGPSPAGPGWSR